MDISIITGYFYLQSLAFTIESIEASYNWHCLFSFSGILLHTVQHPMCWYTQKRIVGMALELCWSDYGLGRSIHGDSAQQCNTYFNYVNAYLMNGYAHIFVISMSYSDVNICLPYGMI